MPSQISDALLTSKGRVQKVGCGVGCHAADCLPKVLCRMAWVTPSGRREDSTAGEPHTRICEGEAE